MTAADSSIQMTSYVLKEGLLVSSTYNLSISTQSSLSPSPTTPPAPRLVPLDPPTVISVAAAGETWLSRLAAR